MNKISDHDAKILAYRIATAIIGNYAIQIDQGPHRSWRWADVPNDVPHMADVIEGIIQQFINNEEND